MYARIFGICLTLALIAYMFSSFNRSEDAVRSLSGANSSDKAALQSAGVDTSKPGNTIEYSTNKALEIKAYQDQANSLPTEEPALTPPENNQE